MNKISNTDQPVDMRKPINQSIPVVIATLRKSGVKQAPTGSDVITVSI